MKLVGLSDVYDDRYTDIQFGRSGWMGRNKVTNVHESLPHNAIVLKTLEEALPEVMAMIAKTVAAKVEFEVKRQLDALLAEAGDAGSKSE